MSITIPGTEPNKIEDRMKIIPVIIGILIGILFCPIKSVPTCPDNVNSIEPVGSFELKIEFRSEWVAIYDYGDMHITCYGPDRNGIGGFPKSGYVSRWFGRSREDTGFTVEEAHSWADELGLNGICAVSPGPSGLYSRHRDDMPAIVEVMGHGRYLVVDRMADHLWNCLDIWVADPWSGGTLFSESCEVQEIELQDIEYEVYSYGYW